MINELDGLARGPEMEHRAAGYARQVQERARKSIEFLEERFESRDNCLRALTSRGNELESISFRSEDTTGQQVRGTLDTEGGELFAPTSSGKTRDPEVHELCAPTLQVAEQALVSQLGAALLSLSCVGVSRGGAAIRVLGVQSFPFQG